MIARLYDSFTTELIKSKNSFASWLILLGALFMPALIAFVFVTKWRHFVPKDGSDPWDEFNSMSWKGMGFMYSGFFIALLVCLFMNIENKSKTWKYLFTLPISKTRLYLNKLVALLLFIICFYILFIPFWIGAGYLSGMIRPALEMSSHATKFNVMLGICAHSFLASLAIFAVHFWLSIRFKNMIIPIALAVIGSIVWIGMFQGKAQEIVYFPYAYPYLTVNPPGYLHEWRWGIFPEHEIYSLGYFVLLSGLCYWDFLKAFKDNA